MGGPREDPKAGFRTFEAEESGEKLRVRPELFADHYSQARQFFVSQTEIEQKHIAKALIFELSKVEVPEIRSRMVGHLLNIERELAQSVAKGLGIAKLPPAAKAARQPLTDIEPSPSLSMLANPPGTFEGRKVGVLVTDGADAAVFAALCKAVKDEGAEVEVIGPDVGGVELSDGEHLAVQQTYEGGPSVLYDAVALIVADKWLAKLGKAPAVRDFIADAHAHAKVIGYVPSAGDLLTTGGVDELDEGHVPLAKAKDATAFVSRCKGPRIWSRETADDPHI